MLLAALLTLGATCVRPATQELSRASAIDIARQGLSFQPDSIEAERTTSGARPIWRVTLRGRLPGQPPGLFETRIVDIDRVSGAIVSIART